MKISLKPCAKCPYKLGLVKTLVNPCPQCKKNHYRTYDNLTKSIGKQCCEDNKS